MSVLERCPSYRESNERSKERQGPTLGVRLIEVSVERESTVQEFYILELRSEEMSLFRSGYRKGTKRLFSVKHLFGKENVA